MERDWGSNWDPHDEIESMKTDKKGQFDFEVSDLELFTKPSYFIAIYHKCNVPRGYFECATFLNVGKLEGREPPAPFEFFNYGDIELSKENCTPYNVPNKKLVGKEKKLVDGKKKFIEGEKKLSSNQKLVKDFRKMMSAQ